MAIRGLSIGRTWPVQSKYDPDKDTDDASVFTLQTLDSRVMGHLRDGITKVMVDANKPDDKAETQINMQGLNFETCQFGIEGWKNVLDDDGNEIEHRTVKKRLGGKDYQIIPTEVLCRLPGAVISEMSDLIRKDNELDEDETEN